MTEAEILWKQTLDALQERISKPSFEIWLCYTRALDYDPNKKQLTVAVLHNLAREWLESRYAYLALEALERISGTHIDLQFVNQENQVLNMLSAKTWSPDETGGGESVRAHELESVESSEHTQEISTQEENSPEVDPLTESRLNPRYTFDTFVIGTGNRFARAAAFAVAETPARAYNPLFIYGGVGLGKTHLMHAIGHHIQNANPASRVVYLSSESFTNEFIHSIQDNKPENFRNRYRSADILLIDDIQFLAKKEQTQEEFFHTFNTLHGDNKQIVITSDRPPKEIPTLEGRLRSRFEWGLITDIQPPDLETRIAILRKKTIADQLDVPSEVLGFIASQIDNNIRELEGSLIRVVAYSALMNQPINVELASRALKDIISPSQPQAVGIREIQQVVSSYYQIQISDLKGKGRVKAISFPRQVAMFLCRELTKHSLPRIGEEFGGRDHSTVKHSHQKIAHLLTVDPQFQRIIDRLRRQLANGVHPVD